MKLFFFKMTFCYAEVFANVQRQRADWDPISKLTLNIINFFDGERSLLNEGFCVCRDMNRVTEKSYIMVLAESDCYFSEWYLPFIRVVFCEDDVSSPVRAVFI